MSKKQLVGVKVKSRDGKYGQTVGTVIKVTADKYIVVIWENVNGEWHYTPAQFERLEQVTEEPPEVSKATT